MKAMMGSGARAHAQAVVDQISTAHLKDRVEALIGPRNRLHAPDRMADVERQIFGILDGLGLDVQYRSFLLEDVDGNLDIGSPDAGRWDNTIYPRLEGQNIVATKMGSGDGLIVVGAHMDTVRDSPGADDNTSAVVALLEVARLVAPMELGPTVVFAVFDMEEIGLHGARAFVEEQLGGRRPDASIIFESVGYTSSEPNSQIVPPGFGALYPRQIRKVKARDHAGDWAAVLYRHPAGRVAGMFARKLNQVRGDNATVLMRDPCDIPILGRLIYRFVPFARDFARSDHKPFWDRNLPAIMITDTADFRNPHYHRRSDLPDTLDYAFMAQIIAATVLTVEALSKSFSKSSRRGRTDVS